MFGSPILVKRGEKGSENISTPPLHQDDAPLMVRAASLKEDATSLEETSAIDERRTGRRRSNLPRWRFWLRQGSRKRIGEGNSAIDAAEKCNAAA
jgi:hypothetical protein